MRFKKEGRKYLYAFLILLVVASIFIFLIINVPEYLTGRVGGDVEGEGEPEGPEEPPPPPGTGEENQQPSTGGSGGESGKTISEGSLSLKTLGIKVTVSKQATGKDTIVTVWEPRQKNTVAGKSANWRLPLRISKNTASEIIFELPSAQYVRVVSDKPSKVSVITDQKAGGKGVQVKIKEGLPGDYNLLFSLSSPFISDRKNIAGGEIISISNPINAPYKDFSIILSLPYKLTKNDALRLTYKNKEAPYITYDLNNDGDIDFIKVQLTEISPNEKEYLELSLSDRKLEQIGTSLASSIPQTEILLGECGYKCETPHNKCTYTSISNSFNTQTVLDGRQKSLCFSENTKCFPVVELEESCSIKREAGPISDENSEVFLAPSETNEKSKEIEIHDKEEGKIANIKITKEKIDITFVQETSSPLLFSPEHCYDGVKNKNEEGIDCGGDCNKICGKRKKGLFYWWGTLTLLAISYIIYNNKDTSRIKSCLKKSKYHLEKKDLHNSVKSYHKALYHYTSLTDKKKVKWKNELELLFSNISNSLAKNKIILHKPKIKDPLNLPYIEAKEPYKFNSNSIDGTDLSRIQALITYGEFNLREKNLKYALADYNAIRKLYSNLNEKEKRKTKRKIIKYSGQIRKNLKTNNKNFRLMKDELPYFYKGF